MFHRAAFWLCVSCLMGLGARAEEAVIPEGPPTPAVMLEHFPDRLHAYVWRNWNLVPTAKLAQVVGATEEQITAMAASMGLPPNRPIDPKFQQQIYITIVRRNWHLLPLDQLLALIEMPRERFAFHLREDDGLDIKLGRAKPQCEPLRYQEPDQGTSDRAAQIKAVVEKHFGNAILEPGEERFAFVERLSTVNAGYPAPRPAESAEPAAAGLKYIYSYFGAFGDPLLDTRVDPYPDGLLQRLSQVGVNGVWLHVVLRQLAPGGPDFPEFGEGHTQRLENLRKMVERAGRYGIRIYLYMNEPRAQPVSFFAQRGDMAGVREGDHIAMCTSDPRVGRWIADSLTHVFREVPGLGGVFTITASENLTSCASHFQWKNCPRCSKRSEAEIIAGVNAAIEQGVHRADPDAQVICWDWGWAGHGEAPDHIALLPDHVWLQSVSEWAQPFEHGGVKGEVGEYSISVVGPGPRALRHWRLAKKRGLKTCARVSFNSTWELSTVPYLPVMDLVAEHCTNLASADVDGLMLSWSLGGYPSPNLQLAERIIGSGISRRANEGPDTNHPFQGMDTMRALDDLAVERFGIPAAPHVRKAWTAFSNAFREFPFGLGLYSAPQQVGPANLLYRTPTGYSATMTCYPYDDLTAWCGRYPPEILADQFEKIAKGWEVGLRHMDQAVASADDRNHGTASEDLEIARAAHTYWASVANQVRFVLARDALARAPRNQQGDSRERTANDPSALRARLNSLLDAEIVLARQLYDLAHHDSRIGFEAANHYFYVPLDLVEKVVSCEFLKSCYAAP